ncbi:Asp-tRNA(Asn)/Glu-tRNA(Gln) amidotransferase A subunit family amidase [Bradyrhizobium sp. CIR18]|nr:Asp-tRNA(Asn)/Glu-tRNA(Gln) amidotransferase A subunit family amidase [Bradyrhizobium sp. CIR18]
MADALHYLELTALAAHLKAREISALEVTRAQLDRIDSIDRDLGSYVHVMAETAMAEAEAADADIAQGRYRGPLHGVPIALKDLFWTEGIPTAAGTTLHRDFRPSADATVVRRLKNAGAVILGKVQLTEGAYADHHPLVKPPKNPWNASYWPGISSSGSAVATAAGLCFGSLGSDTGGSIRWPCAANGLTGLKPSWGRVSRHGTFELAATLDHVGPIGRSAADVGALLGVIAGHDPNDPTSLVDPVPDYLAAAAQDVRGCGSASIPPGTATTWTLRPSACWRTPSMPSARLAPTPLMSDFPTSRRRSPTGRRTVRWKLRSLMRRPIPLARMSMVRSSPPCSRPAALYLLSTIRRSCCGGWRYAAG